VKRRLVKGWKAAVAVALLPACVGAVMALVRIIGASGHADTTWVALFGGAGCWLAVFLLLPKPMWFYVVGHEFTHALWTWVCGGKVKRFSVSAKGGHVIVTKDNFLIVLAPYFFPFYVFLVVLVFAMGNWIWGWRRHLVWFHFLIGAAYAFHVTLTTYILRTRQSDITSQGYLFSGVIIWLGNALVLLMGIPLVTGTTGMMEAFGCWLRETGRLFSRLSQWV
jgi:hypothetical protein